MKRYVMEFIGTFFLTVAISLIGNPLAIGVMLVAMIYIGGHISGAHFNPAISFACLVQNRMKFADMCFYIVAQSVGAVFGLMLFMLFTNNSFSLDMVPGNYIMGPMAIEALLVLVLCWVYLAMNFDNRYKDNAVGGIVIGLTLMSIAFAASLFNPAVAIASIGCNLIKDGLYCDMGSVCIYIVGPLVGAFGSSILFSYFRTES